MNGEWYLFLVLWTGGPIIMDGPYAETDCMVCGEAWYARSDVFVARNPRLPVTGRSWSCQPHYANLDPPVQLSFPTLPKLCEKKS